MHEKPLTVAGYRPEDVDLVRRTALYFATRFGDLLQDLPIVGGYVPSLLVPEPLESVATHVGTRDLDLGVQLALLDEQGYLTLTERLGRAGFRPVLNPRGNPVHQSWRVDTSTRFSAVVEFLIPPRTEDERSKPGRTAHLDTQLAAIIVPGLELVANDRLQIRLDGCDLFGAAVSRDVWVCGPGAYTVLKALAGHLRGEPKDFYDLWYVVWNYRDWQDSPVAVDTAAHLVPMLDAKPAQDALAYLAEDFASLDAVGPKGVASFLNRAGDEAFQADVAGVVQELLRVCR